MIHVPGRAVLVVLLVLAGFLAGCAGEAPAPARDRQPLERGVVAAPERHAARVGAEILAAGGNAVDAAVAVHFALAVTFPSAGNLGGGGFALVRDAMGPVYALDFRETAPAEAHPDLFLDRKGNVVPGKSLWSGAAVGVPGSVRGMWELHRRFGSLPWKDLLAPAIRLAEEGFELDPWTADSFERAARRYREVGGPWAEGIEFSRWFHGAAGETFRQPQLGDTLRKIAAEGPGGFYEGDVARRIVETVTRAGGIMTRVDLAEYRAVWRVPLEGSYRGHRVVAMPPPSSGGVALLQLLGMLERFDVPPFGSAERVHLFAELEKRVFADRSEYLGDPDQVDVPVAALLDPAYLARRAAEVRLGGRTDPGAIRPGLPGTGDPGGLREGTETTHFSIVDRHGMAVAETTTLNTSYGTGLVVEGAGFLLNNEMDDFAAKPGVPNVYGVTGSAANEVRPGRRMLSSMCPTFVYADGGLERLWLVLGSPGGPTIFTTVFQLVVDTVDDRVSLAEAVGRVRFHHQWPPPAPGRDEILVEDGPERRLPPATLERLAAMGYALRKVRSIGAVQGIEIRDGRVTGVADPRLVGAVAPEGR